MGDLEGAPVSISAEDLPRVLSVPPKKYEYLDHTADVQIHAWGDDLKEAFEQCTEPCTEPCTTAYGEREMTTAIQRQMKKILLLAAVGMFGYMTEIESVEIIMEETVEAEGSDLVSLLYHFLDEWLYKFSAEPFFIARKVVITGFDLEAFRIKAIGYGEEFNLGKHPQGTEVKAITYSNLQVHNKDNQHEIYVIIDI